MQLAVQTTWGHLVAWYLFLAGAGAGLYIVAIGMKIWRRNASCEKMAYYASPALVIAGSALLLLDLGQPLRAVLAVLRPHSSMVSAGIIILSLFIVVGLAQGYRIFSGSRPPVAWDCLGLILALATATYTGLLLGVVKAIPFWNNPLLPFLFLVSALSSGIGVLLLFIAKNKLGGVNAATLLPQIFFLDAGIICVETGFLAIFLLVAWNGGVANEASVRLLLAGPAALPFWLFVVGAGLILPLALKFLDRLQSDFGLLVCGAGLLLGALALRYGVVLCGVWIPLGG